MKSHGLVGDEVHGGLRNLVLLERAEREQRELDGAVERGEREVGGDLPGGVRGRGEERLGGVSETAKRFFSKTVAVRLLALRTPLDFSVMMNFGIAVTHLMEPPEVERKMCRSCSGGA